MEKEIAYKNETLGVYGVWNGGPYIDLFLDEADIPFDTVNVFDYEKGEVISEEQRDERMEKVFAELENIYLS